MKIIILKNNLKTALDITGKAIGKNSNLPILSNVLIKTHENKIKILSTNLETGITSTVSGKVIEDGSITIPYDVFYSIISNISDERINLETKGNSLIIKTENYEATVQGSNESEFPIIPVVKTDNYIEVERESLKNAINSVIFSAGDSELRPEINGVYIVIENEVIKIVSTDSFRLSEAKIDKSKFKKNNIETLGIIIPLRVAKVISSAIADDGDKVFIYLDESQIMVKVENVEVVSRLVDGKFPNYEAIIPKTIDTEAVLDRVELINALRLANSFTSKAREVKIQVKNGKVMEVYSSDSSIGENKYIIPVKASGPDIEVVFNLSYLLEGIQTEKSEKLSIGFNDNSKPVLIKTPGNNSYFYILMPVKGN